MKVVIVYDSTYGNTAAVAEAIAAAVPQPHFVEVLHAFEVEPADTASADVLIIGSPTQGGMPTQPILNFVKGLRKELIGGKPVAAFDTRFAKHGHSWWLGFLTGIAGYAATRIAAVLKLRGGYLVVPPAGFIVDAKKGPLAEAELRRASDWAQKVMAAAVALQASAQDEVPAKQV